MLNTYVCELAHAFLVEHDVCPECNGALARRADEPRATLVAHTVVRVNPSGRPFRLGLAITNSGARTLCIIDDGVRGEEVELYAREGCFHAREPAG